MSPQLPLPLPVPPAPPWRGWYRIRGMRWQAGPAGDTWGAAWGATLALLNRLKAPHVEAVVKRGDARP